MLWDAFGAGVNHMWVGPLLGITIGAVAAAGGKWLHKIVFCESRLAA
jgi:hypothetical protein